MRKLWIIMLGIVLISLVIADAVSLWNSQVKLTKPQEDRIKLSSNVTEINVKTSSIVCDEDYCWTTVYQRDVINSKYVFRNTNLSAQELKDKVTHYIEDRLGLYADVEIDRHSKTEEDKSGGGTITTSVITPSK